MEKEFRNNKGSDQLRISLMLAVNDASAAVTWYQRRNETA